MSNNPPVFDLDYTTFQVGGTEEPLNPFSANTLLRDADPPLYFALDYWRWLINTYPGPRILSASSACMGQAAFKSAVAQAYPWPPDIEKLNVQLQFPLLACYRKDSKYTQKTAAWYHDRCEFDLLYILPPLTAAQTEVMTPAFHAVEVLLVEKTVYGFDPNYAPPGGTAGQQPWSLNFAGVEEVGFDRGHWGTWEGNGSLKFPYLHLEGYFLERDMPVPFNNVLAGVDTTIDLVAQDGTQIPFAQVDIPTIAPTVTSLSTAAGPATGGTSVSISGTGFIQAVNYGPAQLNVMFGGVPAASVTWVSATQINVVTPAMQGAGTVNVVVLTPNGQVVVAPQQFVFS